MEKSADSIGYRRYAIKKLPYFEVPLIRDFFIGIKLEL
jgi:hypothetical protein